MRQGSAACIVTGRDRLRVHTVDRQRHRRRCDALPVLVSDRDGSGDAFRQQVASDRSGGFGCFMFGSVNAGELYPIVVRGEADAFANVERSNALGAEGCNNTCEKGPVSPVSEHLTGPLPAIARGHKRNQPGRV